MRHLTGDLPDQARRATAYLAAADELLLPDLIVAELVFVLESSLYGLERSSIASLIRAAIALPSVVVIDAGLLLRALEVYENHGVGFADAYLVASAERSGVGAIASFDRSLDRIGTVRRVEPG